MQLTFREMQPEDADSVAALEQTCFPTPWSREAFWREASNPFACYLLAFAGDQLVGYAGFWVAADEAQVMNVAVAPEYRGQGAGTQLFAALIESARERGCTAMTLEVRPSNVPALALYHHFGFQEAGRRKGYYTDNGEDALIMWRTKL